MAPSPAVEIYSLQDQRAHGDVRATNRQRKSDNSCHIRPSHQRARASARSPCSVHWKRRRSSDSQQHILKFTIAAGRSSFPNLSFSSHQPLPFLSWWSFASVSPLSLLSLRLPSVDRSPHHGRLQSDQSARQGSCQV